MFQLASKYLSFGNGMAGSFFMRLLDTYTWSGDVQPKTYHPQAQPPPPPSQGLPSTPGPTSARLVRLENVGGSR